MLEPHEMNGHARPGFRLDKLEVYNWGTFDSTRDETRGRVYTVRPEGHAALLIGQNGSGKSTLVDALLTLLVRPAVRNYNVAAGAGKRERDERTYIKGAFGRYSRDDDNRADMQFLRPGNAHYSVLLACFRNAAAGRVFTIAQVLYVDSDGQAKKVYCLANDERSIATDCSRIISMDRLKQQMERRGFRVTTTYNEFHDWFRKLTGVQPKAMDMFNQTVAVKDIQRLNDFIREHMLEAKPWGERVESLLRHFSELSTAHQSLVRVRKQFELLEPIAEHGAAYRDRATTLEEAEQVLEAAHPFFCQKTIDLFVPTRDEWAVEIARLQELKRQLTRELEGVRDACRRLQNDIEQQGGARLREIPGLIRIEEAHLAAKRDNHRRFHDAIQAAGIDGTIDSAAQFADVRRQLPALLKDVEEHLAASEPQRNELIIERGTVVRELREDETELQALRQRQGNLPETMAQMRRQLCGELRLSEKELPFAAELIAVKADERQWESSIEMVLRSFALSLLVPPRYYAIVSGYAERTRLADAQGRGQRLVYLKIHERGAPESAAVFSSQSLLRKLEFRTGHQLLPWVQAELAERFDYRCCDTIEEFQQSHMLALTRQRHVKVRGLRHEKDDRDRTADPRNYVLGWDNREKRKHLAERIEQLQQSVARLDQQIGKLTANLDELRRKQSAIDAARQFADFGAIDFNSHEQEIIRLTHEKETLEEQSDAIRVLKQRLGEQQAREQAIDVQRDNLTGRIRELENDASAADRLIANARKELDRLCRTGDLERLAGRFAAIETRLGDEPLTVAGLAEREMAFSKALATQRDRLQKELAPLQSNLITAMGKFLSKFEDERADLQPSVDYLDSFLGLLDRIRDEDLPRHEQRFKDRLNEKVTHEIGLLNGALQTERSAIEDRIELLNRSLRPLEYHAGTHMRLEARPVRDREIIEFRDALSQCLAGTFEGTSEADEARFVEIEKLIARLRDEERWRNKVTDVRRWFDFAARELDDATGKELRYYEDSTGQSGGEKAKLAFTILVAAIAYQYDLNPGRHDSDRFHFVVVDEMFSKVDDQYSEYALQLFEKFGLQLLIVAPLDAKARVTEPYVGCYLHVVKNLETNCSEVLSMTAREFEEQVAVGAPATRPSGRAASAAHVPRQPR